MRNWYSSCFITKQVLVGTAEQIGALFEHERKECQKEAAQ